MRDRGCRGDRGWRLGLIVLASASLNLAMGLLPATGQVPTPSASGIPSANGYDDLLAAAYQLRKTLDPTRDLTKAPDEEVREALEANREALAKAREALGRDCFVPLQYEPAQIQLALDRASALRGLARLMMAEWRLAESEGRRPDAVRFSTDLIRLGQATGRGGLLVESLTGLAIETLGLDALARIMPGMTEAELAESLRSLVNLERTAEPFPAIAEREREFAHEAHGVQMRLALAVSPQMKKMLQDSLDAAQEGFLRVQTKRRLLTVELAIRLYRIREGADPAALTALTPSILRDSPLDPYTGDPLVYRPSPTGHLLYSVGPDGDDDGGRPFAPRDQQPDGDVTIHPGR